MKIISRPRQAGKTTEIIKLAAETNSYIVCPNQQQQRHVFDAARAMGVDIHFPIIWDDFVGGQYYCKRISGFVFDNPTTD